MNLALLLLIALLGCTNESGSSRHDALRSGGPYTNQMAWSKDEEFESLDGSLKIPRSGPVRDVFVNWILGALVVTQIWQFKQFYSLNREVGEANGRLDRANGSLGRIASNSESERATRARVNALILRRLGAREEEITEALKEES